VYILTSPEYKGGRSISQRGGTSMGIFDKAKDALSGQQDKVDAGVEKAGDMVDEKTEGKYAEQVDKGQDMAGDKFSDMTTDQPEPPAGAPPA
jgi:MT0933-like antitoxin protein